VKHCVVRSGGKCIQVGKTEEFVVVVLGRMGKMIGGADTSAMVSAYRKIIVWFISPYNRLSLNLRVTWVTYSIINLYSQ
jgi:hypothetical protein